MQKTNVTIKNWAADDRPREKMIAKGVENLSNSELLAILIASGNKEKSALDLAKEVLRIGKNNLSELGKLNTKELMKIKGIGAAKAITIIAALELGRRRHASGILHKNMVKESRDAASYLQTLFKDYKHEIFAVLFLNRAGKVNHFEIISEGGITGTVADPRIILKKALAEDATSIILSHNHPSGNPKPSKADRDLTNKIKEAAHLLDIKLIDHIIVGEDGYYSFADDGIL
ncbi:MAG TPA: DNA repair protein RadC [Chitinophagaceae bacterium]|nr:DNA repair protein RadC [Chitinophagaceae bacterium]